MGKSDATTAAEKFGKVPNEFLRLPETESYIQALERRCVKTPYVKTSLGIVWGFTGGNRKRGLLSHFPKLQN